MNKFTESRFFRVTDLCQESFVFPLHRKWWSRRYEYPWAAEFAEPDDVTLDAGSGLSHPLKFYLADYCRETHACDLNPRIENFSAVCVEIAEVFGKEVAASFSEKYASTINYRRAPLTALPYAEGMFDKIYCISVIEHLNDACNRHPWLISLPGLWRLLSHEIATCLAEFCRVLQDEGRIILTCDYPRISLLYLQHAVERAGLEFAGSVSFELPGNALYCQEKKLYCYRAVLRKRSIAGGAQTPGEPASSLNRPFQYKAWWEKRYGGGGDSGLGSAGVLAEYKAEVINTFLREHGVESVIEFGCGDGRQLKLMHYPKYLGLDVAPAAIARCRELFADDSSKRFEVYNPQDIGAEFGQADLVVCLDVLYHITEESDLRATLADIFRGANRWVLLFTIVRPSDSKVQPMAHIALWDTLAFLESYDAFRVVKTPEHPRPDLSAARFIVLERHDKESK